MDFETSAIAPVASLNCSRGYLQKQRTMLFAMENPVVRVLHSFKPETIPAKQKGVNAQYIHPLVYRNRNACWEAERSNTAHCLVWSLYAVMASNPPLLPSIHQFRNKWAVPIQVNRLDRLPQ